jgi:glycosyltransferase involved in cell wall biosynthesis
MNILHISSSDLMGGRFNGYSMQDSMGDSYNIEMAVWSRFSKSSWVHLIPPRNPLLRFFALNIMRLGNILGLDGLTGFAGFFLPRCDFFRRADIIHIHLIHNHSNLSILSLPKLSRLKPVIWTIHDPWAITGGCEHSFECNSWKNGCAIRCPHPRRQSLFKTFMPRLHWKIKKRIYESANVTLIVASQWMMDRLRISPLVRHLPCHLIPFGIDLEVFKPKSKIDCRKKLGIPLDMQVIAFRDVGLESDRYKGLSWLKEALETYQPIKPTCLLIFQDGKGFQILSPKYTIKNLGWVDGQDLATAFSAADVFLMPSIQESFGLMAVESMACGTPVIVFDGTALPEIIKSPQGGLKVPAKNSTALSESIKLLMVNDELRIKLGRQAREIAEQNYGFPLYIQRHRNLYDEVVRQHLKVGDTNFYDKNQR